MIFKDLIFIIITPFFFCFVRNIIVVLAPTIVFKGCWTFCAATLIFVVNLSLRIFYYNKLLLLLELLVEKMEIIE